MATNNLTGRACEPSTQPHDFAHPLVQLFAEMFPAYAKGNETRKEVIRSMVEIVNDPTATEEEKRAALDTLVEAIFPQNDGFGVNLDAEADLCGTDPAAEQATAEAHASFAEAVRIHMKARGINQQELATLVGIGQPAISMLLSRTSRPQRATVAKIANALGVTPESLWPGFKP
jgi:predicted XRE-type DNA-binding protein